MARRSERYDDALSAVRDMTEKMVEGIWARWFGDEHQATEGILAELTVGL